MDTREVNRSILAVDVNAKTTKAVLFRKEGERHDIVAVGEPPTTVEAPALDVTAGVLNAVSEIESKTGETLIQSGAPASLTPLLCTSSASGGLHMVVAGLIKRISTESAQRAALGGGGVLLDPD